MFRQFHCLGESFLSIDKFFFLFFERLLVFLLIISQINRFIDGKMQLTGLISASEDENSLLEFLLVLKLDY